ncbi:MAG TPA: NAD(P)-binding protein, partial [Solirubrobacterales bacterium]
GRGGAVSIQEGWREEAIPVYKELAERLHSHGTKVFCELGHMGPIDDDTLFLDDYRALLSPSGISAINSGQMPRAMDEADLAMIRDGFVLSARNAKAGGIDGVEIHAAHGYLLAAFLSPAANKREDQYGGSTENRCRYLIEIGQAIREEVGDDYPIGMRYSFEEFTPDGVDEGEGERILRAFDASGLFNHYSISGGNVIASAHKMVSPMTEKRGILQPFAKRAKEILGPDAPVITANHITTLDEAAAVVESGTADLVAMVRAHLADPFLIGKAQAGEVEDIRECVNCNQGCIGRVVKTRAITCTINPASGREAEWGSGTLVPTEAPRKVLVVGAGPAGLKAAEVAAQRGHQVTLVDREAEIGGSLRLAARLPKRDRWALVMKRFDHSLPAAGVDVRLGTEATADLVAAEAPDAVVLATGASFDRTGFASLLGFRPGIPGLDSTTVLSPAEAIKDIDRCGARVVIVDDSGDYLPFGLAELLADAGKQVEIVTHQLFAGAETMTTVDLGSVYPRVVGKGVTITAQHLIADIADGKATIASVWGGGQHVAELDSIVINMSRSPERALYEELLGGFKGELHRAGDCLAPRHVDEAIYDGEKVGRAL